MDAKTNGAQITHNDGFGLTKREYFAAMAMQGALSNTTFHEDLTTTEHLYNPCELSKYSIMCADALLKELETE